MMEVLIAVLVGANDGELNVLQIGANDGTTGDPLRSSLNRFESINAVLVEPLPSNCNLLNDLYSDRDRVQVRQVAIGVGTGEVDFYYLREEHWELFSNITGRAPTGFASLSRSHVVAHIMRAFGLSRKDAGGLIASEAISMISMTDLLSSLPASPEVILIDAEGTDGTIVESLDLESSSPLLIRFEHRHLDRAVIEGLERRFESASYVLFRDGAHTVAVQARQAVPMD